MSQVSTAEPVWVEPLFRMATSRPRPEDVAKFVLEHFPNVAHSAHWKKRRGGVSYMSDRFPSPEPLTRSANLLARLLEVPPLTAEETLGEPLTELLRIARGRIKAGERPLDFRWGRLNGEARVNAGLELSRRKYNRIFRLIRFLEAEKAGNDSYGEFCELLRGAKSGLLRHIPRETFAKDAQTAIFVAYIAARQSLRSEFTIDSQTKALDDLAAALLDDLERSSTTHWPAVAYAFPRPDVLARTDDKTRLDLLALAHSDMTRCAKRLERLDEEMNVRFEPWGFVVKPGMNSSEWNACAGAWNKARDTWLGLCSALGLSAEEVLPGKVPRLIAADIAAWARQAGKPPHPDEKVACLLPKPWEVWLNGVPCSAKDVEGACRSVGRYPTKMGWTAPHVRKAIENWSPTPELVHGVAIESPELAALMRRYGWFAGPAKAERMGYRG